MQAQSGLQRGCRQVTTGAADQPVRTSSTARRPFAFRGPAKPHKSLSGGPVAQSLTARRPLSAAVSSCGISTSDAVVEGHDRDSRTVTI